MTSGSGLGSPSAGFGPDARDTVVLDARVIGPTPVGIGRYVSLLVRGLARMRDTAPGLPYRIVLLVPERDGMEAVTAAAGFATRAVRAPFLHPLELLELPRALASMAGAAPATAKTVYHSPSFSALLRCPVPWIITVHDLIHLEVGTAAQKLYYRRILRPFIRGAIARTTVSDHSRGEISSWAAVPRDSVDVIANALDPDLFAEPEPNATQKQLAAMGLRAGQYFLCISSSKRHKNVDTLVKAYSAYREHCAASGSGPALPLCMNVPGYEDVPGVIVLGPLRSQLLGTVLSAPAGFFFPSRLEGFGLPPLEAAVAGASVAVSAIPALHESMAPFDPSEVHWVEPMDVPGWTRALTMAASGRLPRASAESRARAVERFSPNRLALAMDGVYRRVLDAIRAGSPPRR